MEQEKKKRSMCAKAQALRHLVSEARAVGLSAKQARSYAHVEVNNYLRKVKETKKRIMALDAMNSQGTEIAAHGKHKEKPSHCKSRAKNDSARATRNAWESQRSTCPKGQQTTGAVIIVRKAAEVDAKSKYYTKRADIKAMRAIFKD